VLVALREESRHSLRGPERVPKDCLTPLWLHAHGLGEERGRLPEELQIAVMIAGALSQPSGGELARPLRQRSPEEAGECGEFLETLASVPARCVLKRVGHTEEQISDPNLCPKGLGQERDTQGKGPTGPAE